MTDSENTPAPATQSDAAATPVPAQILARHRWRQSALLTGFLGGLVGGAVILLLVVAAGIAFLPRLRDLAVSKIDSQVASALSTMATHQAPVPSAPVAGNSDAVADLSRRVSALESHPSAGAQQLDDLSQQVKQLADQIITLKAAMPSESTVAALAARVDAATRTAQSLAQQRQSEEAMLLVLGQLRDAVERGDPYSSELQAARRMAPPEAGGDLDALAASAKSGVSRTAILIATFPTTADQAVAASFAPAGSFWQKIERQASALISVRRTDATSSDATGIVDRAETRLKAGDLAGAVEQLGQLTGPAAASFSDWRTKAAARVVADQALSHIEAATEAGLAPAQGGPNSYSPPPQPSPSGGGGFLSASPPPDGEGQGGVK